MPEMSGVEFVRRATQARPSLSSRTAFITGGTFAKDERYSLEQTTFPVLQKPVDLAALRALVARICVA
jgi:CheY-like chemotaxis protein